MKQQYIPLNLKQWCSLLKRSSKYKQINRKNSKSVATRLKSGILKGDNMTELEYIEKEIKKTESNYNEWKAQIVETESELSEDDKIEASKIIANARCHYEEQLATLNSIKQKLEALEIIKKKGVDVHYLKISINCGNYNFAGANIGDELTQEEYDKVKGVLK